MLLPSCYPGSAWSSRRGFGLRPQRRYLRAMKTRPCAPGKINAPPRLTSQDISPAPFRLFLGEANLSRALIGRRKSGELSSWLELGLSFGRFLADKTAISSERGRL